MNCPTNRSSRSGPETSPITFINESIKKVIDGFHYNAHPMGMFEATLGALSTFYPDAKDIFNVESRWKQIYRLIAKVPTIAAFAFRHRIGMQYSYPDNDLSYEGNFLNMMFKTTELKYQPNPVLERALTVLYILHADHEQNCSTNAMRSIGSAHTDPFSSLAGAAARALWTTARRRERDGAANVEGDRIRRQSP